MSQVLYPNEHIEAIDSRLQLIVSSAHTFGTDALLLAAFAAPKKNDRVCDYGTGCGIIPFYWLSHGVKAVTGVELQPLACRQVRRSIQLNGLEACFTLYEGDLREFAGNGLNGTFDVVTMNPPYTPLGKGILSENQHDMLARHETDITLNEICKSAAKLLKFGGSFSVCLRPERLTDAVMAFRNHHLEPKRLQTVAQRPGKAPWLFLLEGKKGRNPGLSVLPEFYMQTADGLESPEVKKIYDNYRK